MSERCEVCDRPKANTSDEITPETCGIGVVDRPIDDSISQCNAHRVDWRARALAAEDAPAAFGPCFCGGRMSRNPHADAGKPDKVLTVGAENVCIPCTQKALHGWATRALTAEQSLATANETIRGLMAQVRALDEACGWLCGTIRNAEDVLNDEDEDETATVMKRVRRIEALLAPRNAAERGVPCEHRLIVRDGKTVSCFDCSSPLKMDPVTGGYVP